MTRSGDGAGSAGPTATVSISANWISKRQRASFSGTFRSRTCGTRSISSTDSPHLYENKGRKPLRSQELARVCSRKVVRVGRWGCGTATEQWNCHEKEGTNCLDIVTRMVDVITRHEASARWSWRAPRVELRVVARCRIFMRLGVEGIRHMISWRPFAT